MYFWQKPMLAEQIAFIVVFALSIFDIADTIVGSELIDNFARKLERPQDYEDD